MNAKYNVALALLAGVAVGAAAVEVLHAQAKAPAYTIAEIDVSDPAGFKAYADANTVGVPKAGGRFLVRGGKTVVLDGAPPAKRVALIGWESLEQAEAYYNSPAYKALVPNRDKASKFRAVLVEGEAK